MLMIEHILFHNAHLQPSSYLNGWRLCRFPAETAAGMEPAGKYAAGFADGCEIRFVTPGEYARVTLFAEFQEGSALVYKGNHFYGRYVLRQDAYTTIMLQDPPGFAQVDRKFWGQKGFSRDVWRIHLQNCGVVFCGIDAAGAEVRKPGPDEMPQHNMLVYGSSITQGSSTLVNSCSYTFTAGRLLNADVLNKGMGGSCVMERSVADYLAEQSGWDFCLLELGVNMVKDRFSKEDVKERARYLVEAVLTKHPGKYVFLTSIYPNYHMYGDDSAAAKTMAFMEAVREVHQECGNDHCIWIDGKDILEDVSGLTSDLLHPSTEGHLMMGVRLADRIRTYIHE
ncbi:MAG: lipase [Paenibacillaceae bacterium]|jgi:hypothetical protein|nr:lipase [Paenibacillaceae bacterium]